MPESRIDEALCAQVFSLEWEGEEPSTPEAIARLREHQEHCPRCAAAKALARSAESARTLSAIPPSPEVVDEGWASIAANLPEVGRTRGFTWLSGGWGIAATLTAVVLLALGAFWLGQPGDRSEPGLEVAETTPMPSVEEASPRANDDTSTNGEALDTAPGILARASALDGWEFKSARRRYRARLKQGRVAVDYDRTITRRDWVIETPMATLRITGTRFALDASSTHTTLMVEEGTVRMEGRGSGRFMVSGGESRTVGAPPVESREDAPDASRDPLDPKRLDEPIGGSLNAILADVPRQEGHAKLEARRKQEPAPSPDSESATDGPAAVEDHSAERDGQSPDRESPAPDEPIPLAVERLDAHACDVLGEDSTTNLRELRKTMRVDEVQRALDKSAGHWRRRAEYPRASACYDLLEQTPPSSLRDTSRLENARILAFHLDDAARAFQILGELSARKGFVGEQASHERCVILHRQKQEVDAKVCFEKYLERYRRGAFEDNVRRLLEDMQ